MCCVWNLLCKIISFIISLLFLVAVVLIILWAVGILFDNDSNNRSISGDQRFLDQVTGAGLKHFGST